MTQEHSPDELKRLFLELIWKQIDILIRNDGKVPIQDGAEACMFQLLSAIDSGVLRGGTLELPPFILAPYVPDGYNEAREARGLPRFPDNNSVASSVHADISGSLHDTFMQMRAARRQAAAQLR